MRIIITESQEKLLIESIQTVMIKKIVNYINKYYKPIETTLPIADEFINKRMVEKFNGDVISPKELMDSINKEFTNVSIDFIKQIINDWSNGNLSTNYKLSKNISMN